MKRKPEDAPDPSGSKMPRRDGDNSLNESGEVRPWEQRPGMILEVKMRNFMCHQVCINDPEILIKCVMVSQMFFLLINIYLKATVWIFIIIRFTRSRTALIFYIPAANPANQSTSYQEHTKCSCHENIFISSIPFTT